MSIVLVQTSLLCGCGASDMGSDGMCSKCSRRARLNAEEFAGLREFVLSRDGHQCQSCGEMNERRILVHHRKPGRNGRPHLYITLCRRCHPRIHHTNRPGLAFASVALLRVLWREVHPGVPEQRLLSFLADDYEALVWEQPSLFPA
jgi:hypothetical protein